MWRQYSGGSGARARQPEWSLAAVASVLSVPRPTRTAASDPGPLRSCHSRGCRAGTSPKVRVPVKLQSRMEQKITLYDKFLRIFVLSSSWCIVFRIQVVFTEEGKDFKINFCRKVRGPWPPWPPWFLRPWSTWVTVTDASGTQ